MSAASTPPRISGRRAAACCVAALSAAVLSGALAAGAAVAQESAKKPVSDAQRWLSSVQDVVAGAIERNQRSVVSIARIKNRIQVVPAAPFDRSGVLDPSSGRPPADPKDPTFIPSEFATGVVVDSKGLILTNYHVLSEDSQYVVWSQHKAYDAKVIGADPRSDLALLQVVEKMSGAEFVPIRLGNAAKLRRGHFVITLGNPYAIARDGEVSAGLGIVANLSRKAPPVPGETNPRASRPTLHHFGTLIQTDAKLNLGTSGGALLNLDGEMVGLTTALAAQAGSEQAAGYALPVDETFRRVVETLKQGREVEYGLLGISPQPLSPLERQRGLRGARVGSIDPSSAARRGGLRVGDIVTAVAGEAIEDEDALMLSIGRLPAAADVKVEALRGSQKLQLTVSLAKYPVLGKKIFTPPPAWRGVRVDYASVRTAGPFTYPFGPELYDGCVWIREVEKDSPAWQSGLRPGMFITHVENQRVGTPKEFAAATIGKPQVVTVRIGGLRPGEESLRTVRPNAG